MQPGLLADAALLQEAWVTMQIKMQWFQSLRVQIGLAIVTLLLVLVGALGYTLYALELRRHDYLILNLTGQLRVISLTMQEQADHYLMGAPDDYDKYSRDLVTYWQGMQQQVALYDRIMIALESRKFDAGLIGRSETIRCNFNERSRGQIIQSAAAWKSFKAGLEDSVGSNKDEPRLTWAAQYISDHGKVLANSSETLTRAFQGMMEEKLNQIRLFLWIAAGLGMLTATGLLWMVQCKVIRPIERTLDGFARVSRGDFGHVVPVTGGNEISRMAESFNRLTERLNAMFRLTDRINQGRKLDETLRFVHDEFQGFVPLDWVGVFYATPDGSRMILERSYSGRSSAIRQGASFSVAQGALATASMQTPPFALELSSPPEGTLEQALAEDGMCAVAFLPLAVNGANAAMMVFSSVSQRYASEHIEFLYNIVATVSHVLEKTVVMENLVAAAVQGLAKLAESRDPETGDHLVRMALYSAIIVEELGREDSPYAQLISPAYVREVFHFAPMHDIGKVGVPDHILLKPARLDAEERKEMERHPVIGGDVLRRCEAQVQALGHSMFQVGIEIAECHHEKFDGTGYPAGIQGQDIPLSARVVAAADVFDALTSKRPYKEAWTVEQAVDAMQKDAGKHFDPVVIDALLRSLPRMMEIYNRLKHV